MVSLGQQLKAQNVHRDDLFNKQAQQKIQEDKAKFETEQRKIRIFNEDVKFAIQLAISKDIPYRPMKLKNDSLLMTYTWVEYNGRGVYKNIAHANVLDELVLWGKENDLDIYFSYSHDGVGISSWYEVVVKPL